MTADGESGGPPPGGAQAQSAAADALQAAITILNGVPDSACANHAPPPGAQGCLLLLSADAGGIATLQDYVSADVQPRLVVLGLQADGTWGLWYTAPASLDLIGSFPAPALICASGGLHLRAAPSLDAAVLTTLPSQSQVTVDAFRLTKPATGQGTTRGQGWYHVSDPLAGWVSAAYVADVDVPSCDALPPD